MMCAKETHTHAHTYIHTSQVHHALITESSRGCTSAQAVQAESHQRPFSKQCKQGLTINHSASSASKASPANHFASSASSAIPATVQLELEAEGPVVKPCKPTRKKPNVTDSIERPMPFTFKHLAALMLALHASWKAVTVGVTAGNHPRQYLASLCSVPVSCARTHPQPANKWGLTGVP
eukprot:scaffold201749_cov21-Tisochrysis_lutea.AAC.4